VTDRPPPDFAEEILRHYRTYNEAERLSEGDGLLERLRTQELIERHLESAPSTVIDVGGGPGAYAIWLAGLGHEVHLIDPVPEHVEQAGAAGTAAGAPLAGAHVADARDLPIGSDAADAVLMLGPLYHLQEWEERQRALQEALRVLRPGGWVFAAAISRYASTLDGFWSGWIDEPMFQGMLDRVLETGRHSNPTDNVQYFTTSFFHEPEQLHAELEEAGFIDVAVFAVEGIAWVAKDLDARLSDPERRRYVLDLLRRLETEPSILGASPHLLAVARRPTG
jgi:ubiquinone/menaquinone biosynthesis C-methylase UbiE